MATGNKSGGKKKTGNMSGSNKRKELGRGIKALLQNIDEDLRQTQSHIDSETEEKVLTTVGWRIPLSEIKVNPKQPRRDFDEQALEELSESIRLHDIIQPITVAHQKDNGKYLLISGERRFRAAKMAGLKDIPAYVRTANDQELLEMALLENLQRENLNAIEIALSYQRLMEECDLTQEEVSGRMKKERSTVTNYLRLLKLPPDIQKAVRDGVLSMGQARALLSLEQIDEQLYAFREIKEKGMSVRQVEQMVRQLKEGKENGGNKKKVKQKLSPAYQRIEDDMTSHFSTKVVLRRKKNGKGSVVIEFYNDNDLERILNQMNL